MSAPFSFLSHLPHVHFAGGAAAGGAIVGAASLPTLCPGVRIGVMRAQMRTRRAACSRALSRA